MKGVQLALNAVFFYEKDGEKNTSDCTELIALFIMENQVTNEDLFLQYILRNILPRKFLS